MSKISERRAAKIMELGEGLEITVGEAHRVLPTVSRTTLYRWFRFGIDNEPARQLLKLHAANRVVPKTKNWRGFKFDDLGQIVTPSGQRLHPNQIDSYAWTLQMWYKNVSALKEISESLHIIRNHQPKSGQALHAVSNEGAKPELM